MSYAAERAMQIKKLRMWKGLAIASLVLAVISFGWSVSFAFRKFPTTPQPDIGRIYPLNNHGWFTYLTRREWLEHNISFFLFFIFMGVFLTIGFLIIRPGHGQD